MSIYAMNAIKPSESERKAYEEGLQAARDGKRRNDNPHRYLSLEYRAWENGHIWAS